MTMARTSDPFGLAQRPVASLYLRISVSNDNSDSIERQLRDCKLMCEAEGFEVGFTHIDEGVSGAAKVRPAFREWLADAVSGRAQILVAWRFDRISRGGLPALAQLLDVLNTTGARMLTVNDRMDSASASFRITAAVVSELAYSEREAIRARVLNRQASDRRAGYWTKPRPFGYQVEAGKLVQDSTEAPIVRELVDKFLSGASLRSLAGWLTERGIPTPREKSRIERGETLDESNRRRAGKRRQGDAPTWQLSSVRGILSNPAMAGFYPHNGQPARDDQGELVVVSYDPILTPGERARVLGRLDEQSTLGPKGRKVPTAGATPKHALSGLLKCVCGASLSFDGSRVYKAPRFRCVRKNMNSGACEGLSLPVEQVEELVAHAVVSYVSSLEPGSPAFEAVASRWLREQDPIDTAERQSAADAVAEAEAVVADLEAARYERGEFPGADGAARYERLYDRTLLRLNAAREVLAAFPAVTDVGGLLDPETFAEALHAGETADRRALYQLVIVSAQARRIERPAPAPGTDRVTVSYRDRTALGVDFVFTWAGQE